MKQHVTPCKKCPCHCHVNYDGDDVDEQVKNAPACAGFAIMCKNMCKLPYNPETTALIRIVEADHINVFSHENEFITHHKEN